MAVWETAPTFFDQESLNLGINIPGKSISITASFGLSGISPDTPNEKTSADFLIKEADKYLYQSKTTGKNRATWS